MNNPTVIKDSARCTPAELRLFQYSALALLLAIVVSLQLRWFLNRELPGIMDEFVDTQLALEVASGARMYVDRPFERMPLMTLLVGLTYDPSASSYDAFLTARRISFVASLVFVALAYLVARNVMSARAAAFTPFLLFASSDFLERSLRVRADLFSTTFALVALWVVTRARPSPRLYALAGLGLGCAFVTTQKAIYFVVAFAVAVSGRHLIRHGTRVWTEYITAVLASIAGFALPFAAAIVWAQGHGALRPFLHQTLIYGAEVGLGDTYNWTWKYLWLTIHRNPAFWMLGLAGALTTLLEARRGDERSADAGAANAALGLWTLTMVLLILRHQAKFPYVFLNLAPAIAVAGALVLARLTHHAFLPLRRLEWRHATFLALFAYFLVVQPVGHYRRNLRLDLLQRQRQILDRIDAITAPTDAVLDGVGMAVMRPKATPYSMTSRWFRERAAGVDYPLFSHLRRTEPKVLINNYRIRQLPGAELAALQALFVHDWANIWVAGASIEAGPDPHPFEIVASSDYAVIAADPAALLVDGEPVPAFITLAAGRHQVESVVPQVVQFKYAPAARIPPPADVAPFSLFASYDD